MRIAGNDQFGTRMLRRQAGSISQVETVSLAIHLQRTASRGNTEDFAEVEITGFTMADNAAGGWPITSTL